MIWRCPKCGFPRNFAQWDNCGQCGEHKPPPPKPDKEEKKSIKK
jgi:hypothetical protein